MPLFKKKQADDYGELPPLPEGEELPPLPPLPGEEELPEMPYPEEAHRKMKPARPIMPAVSAPSMPSWKPIEAPSVAEKATVFVKLDKYKDIMRTVSDIDDKLAELKGTLDRVAAIKAREGEIIDGWAAMLNDAKVRIDNVHNKLTKPEA